MSKRQSKISKIFSKDKGRIGIAGFSHDPILRCGFSLFHDIGSMALAAVAFFSFFLLIGAFAAFCVSAVRTFSSH
ncbi:MAG TPA: hypothetical protein DHW82_10140 [Spirochaetia bacterium]|nr:MAG: hypothetical protein A2Y41_14180 [Spirochaetes bacterium GWB1_36_13]HCL57350.1 hypothetical protein [Spirochaetia bacterium]